MSLAVSKDELCFVKQRENQIVVTVGVFTVCPLYFLEIREEV